MGNITKNTKRAQCIIVDWSSVMTRLSLLKKLVKHAVRGRIVFFMGYF